MAVSLPDFPAFDLYTDPTSTAQRWKKWIQRFENLLVALDVTKADRKKALLLHYAGPNVQEAYETLPTPIVTDELTDDYVTAKEQLDAYFCPKRNLEYEAYVFRQTKQRQGETLDQFHTRLRQLAATCEFADVDREVKSQSSKAAHQHASDVVLFVTRR